MATINNNNLDGNKIIDVVLDNDESSITLATADTYVDRNIVINIPLDTKANLDSPDFTGTPKIYGENILTTEDLPDVSGFIENESSTPNKDITVNTERTLFLSGGDHVGFMGGPSGNTNLFLYEDFARMEATKNIYLFTLEEDGKLYFNNKQIATKNDLVAITAETEAISDEDNTPGVHTTFYVSDEEITDFTVMNGHKGERGISLLHTSTAPWANTHITPDGLTHTMAMNEEEVKTEAKVDKLYLGDLIEWNGLLYQIAYLGDPYTASLSGFGTKITDVYIDSVGNIKGPQGIQGIQGPQGPQGPKGDPGEGYFIVTDEDYSKIADFIEEKSYHSYQRPDASEPIKPNIFYDFGPQYQLEITFETPQSIYRSNEYMFQFDSPADRPTTLIMPSSVKWCYDPTIEAGKTYQVSVLNDLAVICGA